MKILYITSTRMPTEKANGYQIMKTCEGLSKDHELVLLAPKRKNVERLETNEGIYAYYGVDKQFEVLHAASLDLVVLGGVDQGLRFMVHSATFALTVLMWLFKHRNRFDVVYSRDPIALYLASHLNRFLRLPLFYESHMLSDKRVHYQANLAKRLDGLVVLTKKLREEYIRMGVEEARIMVEPDAVDLAQFDIEVSKRDARKKLGIPTDIKIASFIGSFHSLDMEKGIPEILASAKYLFGEFEDLHFYFVGGPLDRTGKYKNFLETEGLPLHRFVFLEKQAIGDVPWWMKASDVLLMPHPRNTLYSFYVSPLKMFEYMASKRPIVASRLPAIEEILTHRRNALLGEPGNPQSIAENIRLLLNDPEACQTLSEQAFVDVRNHSWSARADRISDFISRTV